MNTKQRKIQSINSWVLKMEDSYCLSKLPTIGVDLQSELLKMSVKQLQSTLALMAAVYSKGCDDTRKNFTSIRGRKPVPTHSHLQVVS